MNKFVLTFVAISVLFVGACNTIGFGDTCIEKVAISKAAIGQVVQQANLAFEGQLIDLETYQQVDTVTDEANLAASQALPMCLSDERAAVALLRTVRSYILESQLLMQGDPLP